MKLTKLKISKLHGCYDYYVDFHSDVTFIYGANGCGKTTILNITEAIITGQLFKLFEYSFEEIVLFYAKASSMQEEKCILIHNGDAEDLSIEFESKNFTLTHLMDSAEMRGRQQETINFDRARAFFERFEELVAIKRTFNYVYLPLNRNTSITDSDDDLMMYRRMRARTSSFYSESFVESNTRDSSLMKIEALIYERYSTMNSQLSKISDDFRNEILKSLLDVSSDFDISTLNSYIKKSDVKGIKQTQNAYIKMLKELKLITQDEENRYNEFFAKFISDLKSEYANESGTLVNLILKFNEIMKIRKLVDLAENMEQQKTRIRQPIELFLSVMKDFIGNSQDGKEIKIDRSGRIYFTTQNSSKPISIQCLSSGEKQLVTFFANLIFSVKSGTSGIFVVDEPELSLHLSWQKIFVEKTLSVNKDIQLIFATHAPEIIGRRREKMFKLEKQYVGTGANEDVK